MLELARNAYIIGLDYFFANVIGVIGILVSIFIAYHIFFLSKRLSNQSKLEHKEKIKIITDELLSRINHKGLRSKVYLVNTNRYFKDYPGNQEKLRSGYSHIHAEVKATRYNGVEFFCSMPEQAYITKNEELTLNSKMGEEAFLVYQVGLVPYEWIEYVDLEGDEYSWVSLFYCKFKGNIYWKNWWRKLIPFGYPYNNLIYYRKSDVYHEGSDPRDMEWSHVELTK